MKKKFSVTIGIPAYQAEKNIARILRKLIKQKQENYKLEKIAIYCDGCTDSTARIARRLKNKKIEVIEARQNQGFAYGVNYLIKRCQSDIFVLLNDDILIKSNKLLDKLINPFVKSTKVTLVNGHIKPLAPRNFVGRCIYVSNNAYYDAATIYKGGQNLFTVDGKIMALKKNFARELSLDKAPTGNLDTYLYLENKRQGGVYNFASSAMVYYRLPETIADFHNQERRNQQTLKLMQSFFGENFEKEEKLPKLIFGKLLLKAFLAHPIESLVFKLFINNFPATLGKLNFKQWEIASTTKNI